LRHALLKKLPPDFLIASNHPPKETESIIEEEEELEVEADKPI